LKHLVLEPSVRNLLEDATEEFEAACRLLASIELTPFSKDFEQLMDAYASLWLKGQENVRLAFASEIRSLSVEGMITRIEVLAGADPPRESHSRQGLVVSCWNRIFDARVVADEITKRGLKDEELLLIVEGTGYFRRSCEALQYRTLSSGTDSEYIQSWTRGSQIFSLAVTGRSPAPPATMASIQPTTLSSSSVAEKKPLPLQSRLESEFLGKPFVTKILLGAYVRYYYSEVQRDCTRLIDTELSPGGSPEYLVRRGCQEFLYPVPPNAYVRPDAMTGAHQVGSQVWVWKIELKDDRIEFWLRSAPNSNLVKDYAKLKLMLGKGYRSWNYDAILDQIAQALRVESHERALALRAEFDHLSGQLVTAEQDYEAQGSTTSARLAAAARLADLLRRLAANRSQFTALGRDEGDPEEYLPRLREVEAAIQELEQQARQQRVDELRQSLGVEAAQASKLKAELQAPSPTTLAQWEARQQALGRYKEVLGRQRALVTSLTSLGEPVPPEEMTELEQNLRWAADNERELALVREGLELRSLDTDFRAMQQERQRLLDRYTRAFNTPQERPALEAFLAHLRRMLENRLAAERMGGEAAAQQAEQLRKEIDKWSQR
jgi:hypothetical protein